MPPAHRYRRRPFHETTMRTNQDATSDPGVGLIGLLREVCALRWPRSWTKRAKDEAVEAKDSTSDQSAIGNRHGSSLAARVTHCRNKENSFSTCNRRSTRHGEQNGSSGWKHSAADIVPAQEVVKVVSVGAEEIGTQRIESDCILHGVSWRWEVRKNTRGVHRQADSRPRR